MSTEPNATSQSEPVESVEVMYAARESSVGNPQLLAGMVYQTLGPHTSDPVVAEVLELGIEPLQGDCPFPHHAVMRSHTKSVVFTHGNHAFIYALGSASKANSQQGENQFVETLCETLVALRPRRLYIHEFTRMVRSADWSNKLMRTLRDTGTVVHTGGVEIDVRTADGRLQYLLLTLIADQDRIRLLVKLFGGVVNKHQRGQWILGKESVPLGYRLEDGKIVLDESQVESTRQLISLMADPSLSARVVIDLAGKAGCTSPTIQRIHGPDATFADVRRADSRLRSLLDCLDVWEHGRVVLRLPNPFPGMKRYGEYEVTDPSPPEHFGFVEFPYELEQPEGGWAAPEVFEAARQRGLSRKQRQALGRVAPTGGASHRKRRPLSGWAAWSNESHHYRLSGNSTFYLLFQRPLLDGVAWTDDRGRNADRIASIDTLELHQAIVDWCLAALRNGAGVELIDALRFWHLPDVRVSVVDEDERKQRLLVSEIDDTTRSYEQARRNANRTTDPDLVDDFPADAALLRGKLRQLEKQLDELGSDTALPTLEQFTSDASFIAHGIAALAHCGADAPAELAAQLSEVLEFTNVALDQVARTVTFTFRLLLPADGKVAYFGPITATVANRAYPGTLKGLPRLEEARTLLCDQSADSPHRATRQLAARLVEIGWSPLAASTLARSGVEPLYRIALQLLGDNQPLDDLDPELVQHVLATYADPKFTWNPRYHHVDCTTRQRLIDLVLAAGGQVTHEDLLNQLDGSGVQPADVTIMSLPQTFGTAPTWPPSILRIGDWGRRSPRSTRSLLVVECPHCDGWASTAVRTPEVPTGLLCPDCRRMPTADSPLFPRLYTGL